MKKVKVMGTINEQGQLSLDQPLEFMKNSRVEVTVRLQEEPELEEYDTPNETIIADFRQAWQEAMTGQTIPVSQLWEGIEDV
ncbi:MAG TPA: hypothetical protein IGS52_18055 [Oscillatoriaceae cyanobacterium M33_DOE_052]|uniref:Uncharacterized protein n=1 Tax=Planktothricoides sp. SpSt-374 TaxID=2282167 RepID=A0A7C3VQ98_9CYAN|nr:hypothetical protein [Oscillatoriaceae cyanobacterium M33_DOE_052]